MAEHLVYAGGKTYVEASHNLDVVMQTLTRLEPAGPVVVQPLTRKNRHWWAGKLPKGSRFVATAAFRD